MKQMKVVILVSGGMDSVAVLYHASNAYEVVEALSFDYGSKHNHKEIPFAQYHCDQCMPLDSIYMLVNVFSDIIMLQRCLNDIIMLWKQKGARLRGMPHIHRHCDSAYCCADLSHQHDVCRLKQHVHQKEEPENIWLLSLM